MAVYLSFAFIVFYKFWGLEAPMMVYLPTDFLSKLEALTL
jgi:hypothetical protein